MWAAAATTPWNASTASKNCVASVAGPHGDHRRPHRGDVVAGRPFERRLGQAELEIQPGFEQVQGVRGGGLKREIQRANPDLRRRAGHRDPAARSRPDRHQVAITQDAQRLVHHRRADAEPVHDLRAAPQVSPDGEAGAEDLVLQIGRDAFSARRPQRGLATLHAQPPSIAVGAAVAPRDASFPDEADVGFSADTRAAWHRDDIVMLGEPGLAWICVEIHSSDIRQDVKGSDVQQQTPNPLRSGVTLTRDAIIPLGGAVTVLTAS